MRSYGQNNTTALPRTILVARVWSVEYRIIPGVTGRNRAIMKIEGEGRLASLECAYEKVFQRLQ